MYEWMNAHINTQPHIQSYLLIHVHTHKHEVMFTHSFTLRHSPTPMYIPHAVLYPLNYKYIHALTNTLTCTKPYPLYSHIRMCNQGHSHKPVIWLFINTDVHSCTDTESAYTNSPAALDLPAYGYAWSVYVNIYTWHSTQGLTLIYPQI